MADEEVLYSFAPSLVSFVSLFPLLSEICDSLTPSFLF